MKENQQKSPQFKYQRRQPLENLSMFFILSLNPQVIRDSNKLICSELSGLIYIYLSIRGIKNLDELLIFLEQFKHKIVIIVLTET